MRQCKMSRQTADLQSSILLTDRLYDRVFKTLEGVYCNDTDATANVVDREITPHIRAIRGFLEKRLSDNVLSNLLDNADDNEVQWI